MAEVRKKKHKEIKSGGVFEAKLRGPDRCQNT